MGVMDIDPLRLLEDGIRSQIGARIARTATCDARFLTAGGSQGLGRAGVRSRARLRPRRDSECGRSRSLARDEASRPSSLVGPRTRPAALPCLSKRNDVSRTPAH